MNLQPLLCRLGWHPSAEPENYKVGSRAQRRREHRKKRPTGRWWCPACGRDVELFRRLPNATVWTDIKCYFGFHNPLFGDRWLVCCLRCMRVVSEEI
jgi:hypothetical protein